MVATGESEASVAAMLTGLIVVALLLLPACHSSPTPATATLSCPTGIGAAAQEPTQAARCLYRAWEAGDRSKAAVFASLDAVDILFAQRWALPEATFRGCAAAIDDIDVWGCRFLDRGNTTTTFTVRRSEGGWRVTAVQFPVHDR